LASTNYEVRAYDKCVLLAYF